MGFRVASQQLKSRLVQILRELHAQTPCRLHGLPAWQFPPFPVATIVFIGAAVQVRIVPRRITAKEGQLKYRLRTNIEYKREMPHAGGREMLMM